MQQVRKFVCLYLNGVLLPRADMSVRCRFDVKFSCLVGSYMRGDLDQKS